MKDLVAAKHEYDRVADALDSGASPPDTASVAPAMEELTLAEPEIARHGAQLRRAAEGHRALACT